MVKFYKMHSLGNDFMVLDAVTHESVISTAMIKGWAQRHEGIGFYPCHVWRLGDLSRGVHVLWFLPLFLDARLPWALSLFKAWVCCGFFSIYLIFFLQLCRYHPFCHYFCGTRGDGHFYQSGCIEAFY